MVKSIRLLEFWLLIPNKMLEVDKVLLELFLNAKLELLVVKLIRLLEVLKV